MLTFDYSVQLSFADGGAASEQAFTLRCIPYASAAQWVLSWKLDVEPTCRLKYAADGFGNAYCYGTLHEAHRKFGLHLAGQTEGFPDRFEDAADWAQMPFRYATDLTRAGEALIQAHEELGTFTDVRARAGQIQDMIQAHMAYEPGRTAIETGAETAWQMGRGVCQDYTHIMLALLRLDGIACRYTAGLIVGEGQSHAWVEAAIDGKWVPFDPTNPSAGAQSRVIFSHGRDALDCEITKGIYLGDASQRQTVRAEVTMSL